MQRLIVILLGFYINSINLVSSKIGGKHAFLLFCYPFPLKLKPKQAKFLQNAKSSDHLFEGKKIATYSWGKGDEVILCLHGWQSNSYRWKKFVESFDKERFKVISVDAPAHGDSEGKIFNVPMYARLIEELLVEYRVNYILAHSLGAFSTMSLFYEKPFLSVEKVAMLGTPGEATDFIDEFVRVLNVHPRVKRNISNYFVSYAGLEPRYYSTVRFAEKQSSEALLIHDTEDKEAPYHYAEKAHQLWPNSTLYTTQGLGHKLRGIEVVNEVVQFFESV